MINIVDILKHVPLLIGIYFLLSTAVAMIRFPDLYTRLHAGSKCLLTGALSILIGCIVLEGISYASLKILILMIFLLITNPVAIHVIASSAYKENIVHQTFARNNHD